MLKFSINSRLPSLNDCVSRNRANRYSGAKYKNYFDDICSAEILRQRVRTADTPCVIIFNWREPNKRRDLDNIFSGKKYVLDAMQKCGVIKNDDQSTVLGLLDTHQINKKNPGVDVCIIERGDEGNLITGEIKEYWEGTLKLMRNAN